MRQMWNNGNGGDNGYETRMRSQRGGSRMGRANEGYPEERSMHGGADTVRHADIVKVIEVLAESPHSWEDAAQTALREASRSVRNIKSIYVKDMNAVVRGGEIVAWRLNAKISFAIEPSREDYGDRQQY
ncbi:MAG: dodecin domain-containing protein [Myxococcales bacterium]|nr:dodecin domain-containing protein [Myxococcales bacterium]